MQVQHATYNWKCAHMHESSSWDCAFCSKSIVIYKVVNVSSLLSPSLSRRWSRSLLPSVTFETNQHLRSIAAIKQIGQIFCILFKTGRSSCFKCERNEMSRDGGLCPLNPDCVAIHSLLDLPFTGSYHSSCLDYEHLYWVMNHFYVRSLSGPVCYSLVLQVPFVINEQNWLSFWRCYLCCWLLVSAVKGFDSLYQLP